MEVLELSPIRVDAEAARAFVLAKGAPRDVARLQGIFGAVGPAREIARGLEELQNADGGFAAGQTPGGPSSIDTTVYLLDQLRDLPPLTGSPMASRAVSFLRRMQQVDGSWQEPEAALPVVGPWAQPGNPESKLYLTAAAAYQVATYEPQHLDPLVRGAGWLRRAVSQMADPAQLSSQTLALCWAVFFKLFGPGAHEVNWSYELLRRRERDAWERAWALACALEIGAGGRFTVRIIQALGELAAQQQSDGSWPAEPGLALESTLTALRVFRGYGII